MVNGLHLYSTFADPMSTKALYFCLTFTHSLTHSYTDGGVIQLVWSSWFLVSWSWTPRHWSGGTRDWTTNLLVCRQHRPNILLV